MNNDILLNSIFSAVSINEIIEKMDESQRNIFLRQIFNYLKNDREKYDANGLDLESFVDFVRYDEKSNSIVVSEKTQYTDYTDDGILDEPAGLGTEYKISIDELQNRINSLISSTQAKVR